MVAAVLQPSDFCRPFRGPPRPLQGRLAASLAAAGLSGGCRSIWRQVLAAAGPLQGRYTRSSFNDAAAVDILSAIFKLCCFSSKSLQVAVSSCVVSNKNRNNAEL